MKKKGSSLFLFCLITAFCTAQTEGYKFYGRLDSIKTSGFYNFEITPELSSYLKTDYSDLRIINRSGKWVPHILHNPVIEKSNLAVIIDLKFTKIEVEKQSTTLMIDAGVEPVSNLGLVIRNTAAERYCTLSGSDDRKNWFVINDSILLNPGPSLSGPTNTFRVDFPPSSYKFFKIVTINNNKDPFDIKGIVQYSTGAAMVNSSIQLIQNPATVIMQKDSGKFSYIKITQQKPYHFDDISLKLSGPKYFYRNVDLYIPFDTGHSYSNPGKLIRSFIISNNSTLQFHLQVNNATAFYLFIHNEDNLPLTINEVRTAVRPHNIMTYLDEPGEYKIIMGNIAAHSPEYDLNKLDTVIRANIPFIHIGKIALIENKTVVSTPPKNTKTLLWVVIGLALLVLLFFTQRMIREIDKRKQHDNI